jgi:putative two-component system response regulator
METKRTKIMLVDDNMANLKMGKSLLADKYEVYPAQSAEKMFQLMEKIVPDLILLDIEMPDASGYDAIKILKSKKKSRDIPVIFLTSKRDEKSEYIGLSLGAIDYIFKPFSAPLLLRRIENHLLIEAQKDELSDYNDNLEKMVEKKTAEIFELQNSVLDTVSELIESRDGITGGHITRTQKYLEIFIEQLIKENVYSADVTHWNLDFLLPSAKLHDIGKIAIADSILNKRGTLTGEEFEKMKLHVPIGVAIIERIKRGMKNHEFLDHAKIFAGTHHERWNGSGYPDGLKGEGIPLLGRLMAVVDVYDALISTRPYKRPLSTQEADDIIEAGSGTHFEPALVEVFHTVSGRFSEIAEKERPIDLQKGLLDELMAKLA